MPSLQFDTALLSPRGAVEKVLALVPILIALATGVIALLQVVNGLPADQISETVVVGWLLATPVAALLLWPLPDAVPAPDLSTDEADADAEDPVERLRDRYAAGEIDRAEFERRLEDLLATEDQPLGGAATDASASGVRALAQSDDRDRIADPE